MNQATDNPSPATFQDFGLDPKIQQSLSACGFERPTEIQEKAIPILLGKERVDFHGQAQTGTGKTLAFGLPLLHRVDRANKKTQALIIAPTRELAMQICDSIRPMASSIGVSLEAIYGGASMEVQLQKLRRGVHIVVGTPGRIMDHMRRGSLNLDLVHTLVLDEADIMLDMGFKEDIDSILEDLPENREIWLFSATVKSDITSILKTHMKEPKSVRISQGDVVAQSNTKHFYCVAPQQSRLAALCRFIECTSEFYGFIFCQTKILASQVAEQLLMRGYRVGALHGDLSQGQRNMIIKRFKSKELTVVVATDVAARGIDVANLTHVVNFSFPEDQEIYIHRAGRTGRAGRDGIAITFVSKHELHGVRSMQRKFNVRIEPINVPDREAIIAVRMQHIATYIEKLNGRTDLSKASACVEIVRSFDEEACRKTLAFMLYDMFLKQVDDGEKFGDTPSLQGGESAQGGGNGGTSVTEISLNVGSDDGVEREDVVALLEAAQIPLDSISKVRVLKRCTFIHVLPEHIAQCIESLHNSTIKGRTVRATKVQGEAQGSRSGGGDRRGGGRSGGGNRFGGGGGGFGGSSGGGFGGRRREYQGGGNREGGGYGRSEGSGHGRGESQGYDRGDRKPEVYQPRGDREHGSRDHGSDRGGSSDRSGGRRRFNNTRSPFSS